MTQSIERPARNEHTFVTSLVFGVCAVAVSSVLARRRSAHRQLNERVNDLARSVEELQHQQWYAGYAAGVRDQINEIRPAAGGEVVQLRHRRPIRP